LGLLTLCFIYTFLAITILQKDKNLGNIIDVNIFVKLNSKIGHSADLSIYFINYLTQKQFL